MRDNDDNALAKSNTPKGIEEQIVQGLVVVMVDAKVVECKDGWATLKVPVAFLHREEDGSALLRIADIGPLATIPQLRPLRDSGLRPESCTRLRKIDVHVLGDIADIVARLEGPVRLWKYRGIGAQTAVDALGELTAAGLVSRDWIRNRLMKTPARLREYDDELVRRGI